MWQLEQLKMNELYSSVNDLRSESEGRNFR